LTDRLTLRNSFGGTKALAWCWEHWGTTWPLRRVEEATDELGKSGRFCSVEWIPWPLPGEVRERLEVEVGVKVDYG